MWSALGQSWVNPSQTWPNPADVCWIRPSFGRWLVKSDRFRSNIGRSLPSSGQIRASAAQLWSKSTLRIADSEENAVDHSPDFVKNANAAGQLWPNFGPATMLGDMDQISHNFGKKRPAPREFDPRTKTRVASWSTSTPSDQYKIRQHHRHYPSCGLAPNMSRRWSNLAAMGAKIVDFGRARAKSGKASEKLDQNRPSWPGIDQH